MMPPLQPFVEIVSQRLCVPSLFLIGNDVERNFLKLLNRHPALRQYVDTVNAAKEPLALAQLSALFPDSTFKTTTRVRLPGVTDVDLVIYEFESGFTLLVQHKWLIAPDTVSESTGNDEELRKGLRQALKARDYCRESPALLLQALSLPGSSALSRIEAVVLCRGGDSTGFVDVPAVPVMTEKAFRCLLDKEQRLPQLWNLANARPDLSEASSRFLDGTSTIKLAGYEFVIPVLAR